MPRDWGIDYLQPAYSTALAIFAALLQWRAIQTKSPEEHVVDAWWTSGLRPRTQKATTKYYRPRFYPPAYRCVRVKFFSGDLSCMMDDTCLFSDFYLDDAGNLDLKLVRGRWGLDNIQFVIYSREDGLKVAVPRNLDLLAAKHVDAVKGHDGCIRIIEVPSVSVQMVRHHRSHLMDCAEYAARARDPFLNALVTMMLAWLLYLWLSGSLSPAIGSISELSSRICRFPHWYKFEDMRALLS